MQGVSTSCNICACRTTWVSDREVSDSTAHWTIKRYCTTLCRRQSHRKIRQYRKGKISIFCSNETHDEQSTTVTTRRHTRTHLWSPVNNSSAIVEPTKATTNRAKQRPCVGAITKRPAQLFAATYPATARYKASSTHRGARHANHE